MRFEVGDRVSCDGHTGTIVEAIRQRNVGDLFRVYWDGDPQDSDLYQDILLTHTGTENVLTKWVA